MRLVELDRHVLLNSLYGVLVMDYLGIYFPSLTGNAKWAGACLVLIVLAYFNARGIQVAGWLSVALLVAVMIPVTWLCAFRYFTCTTIPSCRSFRLVRLSAASSVKASRSPCGITPATSSFPAQPAK